MSGHPGVTWQAKPGLADEELDGERVVWDPASGRLARLDRIGSLVWACLHEPVDLDALSADVADAFGAPVGDVRADVAALLRRLADLGLVVEQGEGSA